MLSVIMAGGVGQRFWPRSRRKHPKQLIDLTGKGSMLSLTVDRMLALSAPEEIFVITNAAQVDAIIQDIGDKVPAENIVGEPVGRNTAPSIGLAAVLVERRFGDVPFMVLPADHLIGDDEIFVRAARAAESYAADNDSLLTFGINPSRPETGYGYIHAGKQLVGKDGIALFEANSFQEKPTVEKAAEFLAEGTYFWNSGMFFWRPSVIRRAIKTHIADLDRMLVDLDERLGTENMNDVLNDIYGSAPSISIDYGIMEKAGNVVVLRGDFYWNDVGSWESVREIFPKDADGNVLVGNHLVIGGGENTVFAPNRFVALIDVEGIAIVDSGDAILVCRRDSVQQVRDIVETLEKDGKENLI
ncbi:MAG: mannose-1-phosphate guanylyltransferase [Deltaproteobacteria bacterium]|nr:MAG: mannose-1-phosphate guanylyltransferase [Deltaproteobacteria bacterium]